MDKEVSQENDLQDSQYLCPFCNAQGTWKGILLQLSLLIAPILLVLIALFSIA